MATVVLIIHLMIAAALVTVVLLQRSEGGALGIGGGSGFMTGRGTANLLTRTTAALAAAFFVTSMILSILASREQAPRSIFDPAAKATAPASGSADPAAKPGETPAGGRGGILDKLQGGQPSGPAVPQTR